ncbi:MAG: amidophosphoribosyltransferase [archaeon]
MEEGIGEECGVVAVYLKKRVLDQGDPGLITVPYISVSMLDRLQHRGQKSAGICSYNPRTGEERFHRRTITPHKDVGMVQEVFRVSHKPEYESIMQRLKGVCAIGHNRYSTSGGDRDNYFSARDETQPFLREHSRSWKRFALAFNGNIANSQELREEMESDGGIFETEVDTEVIRNILATEIKIHSEKISKEKSMKPDTFEVYKSIMQKLDGSYNIVSFFGDGDLVVARDPHGFRPLVYGENKDYHFIASESRAFDNLKVKSFRDVQPGEVLVINQKGMHSKQVLKPERRFCHFEYIYFSNGSSKVEGQYVQEVRDRLGLELALIEPLQGKLDSNYMVVPAPKTAIPAAESFAKKLNLEFKLAIEKDGKRGFINGPLERKLVISSGYTFHHSLQGRRVIIVDDSLVRGDTITELIRGCRAAGVTEVHVRITNPPLRHPCPYGIDFPTSEELIANKYIKNGEDIAKLERDLARHIGADSLKYQTLEGLIRAVGISQSESCIACLNGDYPTPCGKKLAESQ